MISCHVLSHPIVSSPSLYIDFTCLSLLHPSPTSTPATRPYQAWPSRWILYMFLSFPFILTVFEPPKFSQLSFSSLLLPTPKPCSSHWHPTVSQSALVRSLHNGLWITLPSLATSPPSAKPWPKTEPSVLAAEGSGSPGVCPESFATIVGSSVRHKGWPGWSRFLGSRVWSCGHRKPHLGFNK